MPYRRAFFLTWEALKNVEELADMYVKRLRVFCSVSEMISYILERKDKVEDILIDALRSGRRCWRRRVFLPLRSCREA